jgi:hypothetical protein
MGELSSVASRFLHKCIFPPDGFGYVTCASACERRSGDFVGGKNAATNSESVERRGRPGHRRVRRHASCDSRDRGWHNPAYRIKCQHRLFSGGQFNRVSSIPERLVYLGPAPRTIIGRTLACGRKIRAAHDHAPQSPFNELPLLSSFRFFTYSARYAVVCAAKNARGI